LTVQHIDCYCSLSLTNKLTGIWLVTVMHQYRVILISDLQH